MIGNPCIMSRFGGTCGIMGVNLMTVFVQNGPRLRRPLRAILRAMQPAKSGMRNSPSPFVTCQLAGTPIQTEHLKLFWDAGTYGAECWLISS